MLTDHVGLLQITSREEWLRVRPYIAWQGSTPALDQGCVVGIVCIAGTPLGGSWPLAIDSIQVHQSAGLLRATVETGCYLADSVALTEVVFVRDLSRVLVVDIGPTRFYPD